MFKRLKELTVLPKVFGILFLAVFFGGLVSALLNYGILRYLASNYWIDRAGFAATAVGLITAVCAVWFFLPVYRQNVASQRTGSKKTWLTMAILSLFGFYMGVEAVLVTGPMIVASAVGRPVEVFFIVEGAEGHDRGCRKPVVLSGLPFLFNKLCGMPDSILNRISPGTHIIVTGHGTPMGLFVESGRIVEQFQRVD